MLAESDRVALHAMVDDMESAWAARDAAAYAAQFTKDAEHINAYGMWWRGRREIEDGIRFALENIYPDNPIAADMVEVTGLSTDIAVVQYRRRLGPYGDPDGKWYEEPQGRVTDTLVRTPDGWRIRFFHSTFINPGVPQPR
jgi:uncharacterized protein (TIGR02246 family)